MKLEQQVVSLPLAKRLKELGVKQESYFWYWGSEEEFLRENGYAGPVPSKHALLVNIATFTVAELGEMLPAYIWQQNSGEMVNLQMQKMDEDTFVVSIMSHTDQVYGVRGKTEAEARALMLVYLLENGLITKDH